jgi:RNA polymerase sigma-54 factor
MNTRRHELQYRPELRQYLLPTLVYYLKLIELPNLEVETYLRKELETNPLLEDASPDTSSNTDEEENYEKESDQKDKRETEDLALLELFSDNGHVESYVKDSQFDPLDNVPAFGDILYDVLMKQAKTVFNDKELEIAELVIANIEEDGYLAATPEEIAGSEYPLDEVKKIIERIQRFEPVGCAWRDTREPLLIQLKVAGHSEESPEYIIVRDYLKDLRGNHQKDIMRKLNIDEQRFLQAKKVIAKLDPKPGWRYSSTPCRYVTPDFIIYWNDNKLCASLTDEQAPRIKIRRQYIEIIKHRAGVPKEHLDFVRQRVQSAQNLIMAIEQRRRTLTRIINGILDYQREFFEKGYNFLRPITMTEFAKQLNVNPSTISRALANKYLESPWGIHKLKFFFTAAVGHTDKRIIFTKIKAIIDSEDKTSPLSDTQIVKKLSREGIIISRRTISKYRDILGIPAHQFRRE